MLVTPVPDMTRLDGGGAEGGVADDDLLLGDHLGDLVIVAQTVLQAQDHGVLVDHRQRIADSRLQVLIVYENDQQIHHADLLGIGGSHGGTIGYGFAIPDAGNAFIQQNAVFPDSLDDRGIGVQHTDLVYLGKIACIAAADGAAADKSDFHGNILLYV